MNDNYDSDDRKKLRKELGKCFNIETPSENKQLCFKSIFNILKMESIITESHADIIQNIGGLDESIIEDIRYNITKQYFGWYRGKYILHNNCLEKNHIQHTCKFLETYITLGDSNNILFHINKISNIFTHKKYGSFATIIFTYSLYSAFSSIFIKKGITLPFYLQLATLSNPKVFRFIKKIMEICDPNVGIHKNCSENRIDSHFCDYKLNTLYPTGDKNHDIGILEHSRDVPVLVDGTSSLNRKYYETFLCAFGNIDSQNNIGGRLKRLHAIPIMLTTEINEKYHNLLNVNLSNFHLEEDFINQIESVYGLLSSYVYEFIVSEKGIMGNYEHFNSDANKILKSVKQLQNELRHEYFYIKHEDALNMAILTYIWDEFCNFIGYKIQTSPHQDMEDKNFGKIKQTLSKLKLAGHDAIKLIHINCSPNSDYILGDIENNIPNEYRQMTSYIKEQFMNFKCYIKIIDVEESKNFYIYTTQLLKGTKIDTLRANAQDVANRLGSESLEINPDNKNTCVKINLPKKKIESAILLDLLKEPKYSSEITSKAIPYIVGTDRNDKVIIKDIANFTHTLIGGTTGSGKSNVLHCIVLSIIEKTSPDDVKLLLMDMKGSTFSFYYGVKHLAAPIALDVESAIYLLEQLKNEMERRNNIVRDEIKRTRKRPSIKPYIVCIVEEYIKLAIDQKDKTASNLLTDLLCLGREFNIYMILTLQNTDREILPSTATSNLDTRIALRTKDVYQSKRIFGVKGSGAEFLHGKGDMILSSEDILLRVQSAYVSDDNVAQIVEQHLTDDPQYLYNINEGSEMFVKNREMPVFQENRRRTASDTKFETTLAKAIFFVLGEARPSKKK